MHYNKYLTDSTQIIDELEPYPVGFQFCLGHINQEISKRRILPHLLYISVIYDYGISYYTISYLSNYMKHTICGYVCVCLLKRRSYLVCTFYDALTRSIVAVLLYLDSIEHNLVSSLKQLYYNYTFISYIV